MCTFASYTKVISSHVNATTHSHLVKLLMLTDTVQYMGIQINDRENVQCPKKRSPFYFSNNSVKN